MIKKYKLDILSQNETNLNYSIDTNSLNIPTNYTCQLKNRGTGSRGGCGFIVSKNSAIGDVKLNTNSANIEAKWVKSFSK